MSHNFETRCTKYNQWEDQNKKSTSLHLDNIDFHISCSYQVLNCKQDNDYYYGKTSNCLHEDNTIKMCMMYIVHQEYTFRSEPDLCILSIYLYSFRNNSRQGNCCSSFRLSNLCNSLGIFNKSLAEVEQ